MKSFVITDKQPGAAYSADSVNHAIRTHNRLRQKIRKKEARLIHAFLKGHLKD